MIGTDFDILVATSGDDGISWTSPVALSSTAPFLSAIDAHPEIASDSDGNWLVTWHSNENIGGNIGIDYDIFISRSTDLGASWTVPVPLAEFETGGNWNDQEPHIAMDPGGRWVVVWASWYGFQGTGNDRDIFFASGTLGASSSVPALEGWGLAALAAALLGVGGRFVRRLPRSRADAGRAQSHAQASR